MKPLYTLLIVCLVLLSTTLMQAQNNPVFFADSLGHIKCINCAPGDTGTVNGVVYEAVDRNLLNQRRDQGADLTKVCTSPVTDMSYLFYNQYNFNQDITNWDISHVTTTSFMFTFDTLFNQPIGNWDVSQVTNFGYMFDYAFAFNQPIGNWDMSHATTIAGMFKNASAFNQPIGNWNISQVNSMYELFAFAISFNQPINNWNTSQVTNMYMTFRDAYAFNQPIDNWNVSQVTEMGAMFQGAHLFNQPIGNWNVSNVVNMGLMFESTSFNQPIGNWNTSSVTNMGVMFRYSPFNQPIGNWNVSNVTNMESMFSSTPFNQPIGNWNVSNVTNMAGMFGNSPFNQPVGNWNVSNVTNMAGMFGNSPFNQPVGNWNVSNVTNMAGMFSGASSFNQAIGGWDVSQVQIMGDMFAFASSFNQPIGNWNTGNVRSMTGMLRYNNFNQPIGNWNTSKLESMAWMFEFNTQFNQPIGNWNVSHVTDMHRLFWGAASFNQPIGDWNIVNVTEIWNLFAGASSFNQPIGNWDVSNITNMWGMFMGAANFNQPINTWCVHNITSEPSEFGAPNLNPNYRPQWGTCPMVTPFADTSICLGKSIVIWGPVPPTYLSAPIHYSWSTGDTTQTLLVSPSQTTTYYCTLTNGIQSVTDSMRIIVRELPNNPISQDSLITCTGSAEIIATTGYTHYRWSTGDTVENSVAHYSGLYSIAVTDSFGCVGTDSIRITVLDAQIQQHDTTLCVSASSSNLQLQLNSKWHTKVKNDFETNIITNWSNIERFTFNGSKVMGPYCNSQVVGQFQGLSIHDSIKLEFDIYLHDSWDGDEPFEFFIDNNLLTTVYFNNYPGISTDSRFQLIQTLQNRCSSAATKKYHATLSFPHTSPNLYFKISQNNGQSLCDESWSFDDVIVDFESKAINLWSTGDTSATIFVNPTQNTSYFCTMSNGANSCTDSINVTVLPLGVNVFVQDSMKFCSNGVLSAPANGTYSWNTGDTTQSITVNSSGWYACTFANACSTVSDSVYVTIALPSSTSSTITACNTYTWPVDNQSYTASGLYINTYINPAGCMHTDSLQLDILFCQTTLQLGCLIEGYYNCNGGMEAVLQNEGVAADPDACDTIEVALHSALPPYALQASVRTILRQNGTATCVFPYQTGSNYIVIRHRNALETWSTQPIAMDTLISYDFRTAAAKAYGSNQKDVSGNSTQYALISGELNKDNNIDIIDLIILSNDIDNFEFGYVATDINGDGNVDLFDMLLPEANVNMYAFVKDPATAINTSSCNPGNVFNPSLSYGSVTDQDGHEYKTIQIGSQEWMAENLRTGHYRNGDAIPVLTDNTNWTNATSGATCWYNNDSTSYNCPYGRLYNWYAVADGRNVCPLGWHVPLDQEWNVLLHEIEPGIDTSIWGWFGNNAGGRLKGAGVNYWNSTNTGADNTTGFSALPGGGRFHYGGIGFLGSFGYWWSADQGVGQGAPFRRLFTGTGTISREMNLKDFGFSVRCVKDTCNTSSSSYATACDSYVWNINNQTYTQSGTYTATAANAANCLHTNILNLIVNYSYNNNTSTSTCNSYTWYGNMYTASGMYTHTSLSIAGCQLTENLNLVVNYSTASSANVTACDNYTWNATTYTTSGTYTVTSLNTGGCTHTSTLNLSINNSSAASSNATACDSYSWQNNAYTATGTYTATSLNASSCMHTDTLNLQLNVSTSAMSSATACGFYLWSVNGQTYTASGTYTYTSLNAGGCTHSQMLNLSITATTSSASATAVGSYTWSQSGLTYTQSGTYTATSVTASGCIMTHTLNLTINLNGPAVQFTVNNMSQSSPNSFEFDIWVTNIGTATLKMSSFSFGLNTSPNMGTLGITYISGSKDALFNVLPSYSPVATLKGTAPSTFYHLRMLTTAVAAGTEPALLQNVAYRLGRFKVNSSISFANNQNPFQPPTGFDAMQATTLTGYTQCILKALVNGSATISTLYGTANPPGGTNLNVLYANIAPDPNSSSAYLLNCLNTSSNMNATACDSYTWAANGQSYTTSGIYTRTTIIGSGPCTHTQTLNLTIHNSTASSASYTANGSYTWAVNGQTYTQSGTYTATSLSVIGCTHTDSVYLTIEHACNAANAFNPNLTYGSLTDQDGNLYKTIQIGTQEWMAENLRVGHYRNGDAIPVLTNNALWSGLSTGACGWYNNDSISYNCPYGRLYNWFTVADSRNVCPLGWHVPSDAEWNVMVKYVEPSIDTTCMGCWTGTNIGGMLKSTGTNYWINPNTGASNSTGFSALPAGSRDFNNGYSYDMGIGGAWWSSTEGGSGMAIPRNLYYLNGYVFRSNYYKQYGFSVRCIRD